jgi:2-dehydropantoate 2-reductase
MMDSSRQKIWVIGAGAVGSALAAMLTESAAVTLVGDSPHADAIRREGLRIQLYGEEEKRVTLPVRSSQEMEQLGSDDWVFLSGKIWSLADTAKWLKDCIHPGQWILALQNGMGFEADLEKDLKTPVQRGIVQFGANSRGEGDVRFYRGKLILPPSAQATMVQRWLAEREVVCEIVTDFQRAQWHKLLINSVANPLAGLLKINNQAVGHPDLNNVKRELLAEVLQVAAAEGVQMAISLEELNAYFKSENVPSLLRDLERGKPTEVDYINGYVAERGQQHGIHTPVNASLTAMIHFLSRYNFD